MKRLIYILLILLTALEAQTKRDPRVVGMAGAYTTIANGIFSVGYNPGLIGLQQNKPFMMQGLQLDFGVVGNFFSIENIAFISGVYVVFSITLLIIIRNTLEPIKLKK